MQGALEQLTTRCEKLETHATYHSWKLDKLPSEVNDQKVKLDATRASHMPCAVVWSWKRNRFGINITLCAASRSRPTPRTQEAQFKAALHQKQMETREVQMHAALREKDLQLTDRVDQLDICCQEVM